MICCLFIEMSINSNSEYCLWFTKLNFFFSFSILGNVPSEEGRGNLLIIVYLIYNKVLLKTLN